MEARIDILCLEWPQNERDVFGIAPIIIKLREIGYVCVTGDIFNYLAFLYKYRPKVLLMTSFQGAKINTHVCRVARNLGIKVITLIAEGDVKESSIEQDTWGNNKEREEFFDKMLLWSDRSQALMSKYYPQLKDKTLVVGAVGFDRYKILKFLDKTKFFENLGMRDHSKSVVGLAGWGFDRVHETDFYDKNREFINADYSPEQLQYRKSDFEVVKVHYARLVDDNPDIFFIARPHPGLLDYQYDEFSLIRNKQNVYYSQPRVCPHSISDLISVSDLWGGYETTTVLDAWLLDKNTFLYNPSGPDFERDITAKGSHIFKDYNELNCRIKEMVSNSRSKIDAEEKIQSARKEIIRNLIGWDDGKNHVRAASEISNLCLMSLNSKYNSVELYRSVGLLKILKYFLRKTPNISKFLNVRDSDDSQIEKMISRFKAAGQNT